MGDRDHRPSLFDKGAVMTDRYGFGKVGKLVLIGGGDTMVHAARRARALGLGTIAILSPRHAVEELAFSAETLQQACRREADDVVLIDDIEALSALCPAGSPDDRWLGLCFGPAWIFPQRIRNLFAAG